MITLQTIDTGLIFAFVFDMKSSKEIKRCFMLRHRSKRKNEVTENLNLESNVKNVIVVRISYCKQKGYYLLFNIRGNHSMPF